MALKVIKGDIFDPKLEEVNRIVVHGCNAQGVMGSGIAKTIRDMYPEVYEDYKEHEEVRGLYLGDIIQTLIHPKLRIASIITQEYYGRDFSVVYVNYWAIKDALTRLVRHFKTKNEIQGTNIEIHLPFIGGGLANGDRAVLLEIFEEVFKDFDATLFVLD
jgi:hypothetical protein